MKANQVKAKPTELNWINKSESCHYCHKPIKKGYGIMVGQNTYCDYNCLADHKEDLYNDMLDMQ